jgi:DNA-binding transcriptional ArsR family regulator
MTKAEKELRALDTTFAALAHPARRQILLALKFRGGAMTAGDIADRFSCAWPTTTRHLRALLDAELIGVRKDGRERLYEINAPQLIRVVGDWLSWFEKA